MSQAAAADGAAILAINPLHALFSQQRDRASPYYPSDRRFLDPIYLDLAALDDGLEPLQVRPDWASLSAGADVDYPAVWALKQAALELRFVAFDAACRDYPDSPTALDFAVFRHCVRPMAARSRRSPGHGRSGSGFICICNSSPNGNSKPPPRADGPPD